MANVCRFPYNIRGNKDYKLVIWLSSININFRCYDGSNISISSSCSHHQPSTFCQPFALQPCPLFPVRYRWPENKHSDERINIQKHIGTVEIQSNKEKPIFAFKKENTLFFFILGLQSHISTRPLHLTETNSKSALRMIL